MLQAKTAYQSCLKHFKAIQNTGSCFLRYFYEVLVYRYSTVLLISQMVLAKHNPNLGFPSQEDCAKFRDLLARL